MSNNISKKPAAAPPMPAKAAEPKPSALTAKPLDKPLEGPPPKPRPLFRPIDYFSALITAVFVFVGYLWTIAPQVTLQDSGELAVASMYAGVPHPPGYPVWTVYTWLFTKLLPFSNIAWRVAMGNAVSAMLTCGMIALLVSRGSSMMIEGIEEFKNISRRLENAFCVIAGFVAGLLMGYNGFMWSQAVIVEVYCFSLLSLSAVLLCLLRWIHAPHQRRYLYLAMFWFGICFNNHQSLLVCALSIEITVMVVQPKLARDLFFWNVIIWIAGLIGKNMGMVSVLSDNTPLFTIYNLIGIGSAIAWVALLFKTKKTGYELGRDFAMVATVAYLLVLFGHMSGYAPNFYYNKDLVTLKTDLFVFFNIIGLGCIGAFVYFILMTRTSGREWLSALYCGGSWSIGAIFYLYMALASMSNPPLNWGYPRTVTGFFHALTRGQYERIHPTTNLFKFFEQVGMYLRGALEEFNLVYLLLALIPLIFYRKMQKRERAWVLSLGAFYLFLSLFLIILLNPAPDRQSQDLNKVFFTASHVMIAMGVGYAITLLGSLMVTAWDRFQIFFRFGTLAILGIALYGVADAFWNVENPLVHDTAIVGLCFAIAAAAIVWLFARQPGTRLPVYGLLCLAPLLPVYSIMSHWEDNEQRGHLFGYWFGHDMFTPPFNGPDGKPIFPQMDRDTVLFGGTDPGRFVPTYMIYDESFIQPKDRTDHDFDRRDVYLITQNALADGTYLNYIRAQYNRSAQIDPPFFQEFLRGPKEMELNTYTNWIARLAGRLDNYFLGLGDDIEKQRRAGSSFFKEKDFTDLNGFVAKLQAQQDPVSKFLFENVSQKTQQLITSSGAEKTLPPALATDLNKLIERELTTKKALAAKLEEKGSLDYKIANHPTSGKVPAWKEQAQKLDKEIADLRAVPPLYTPERFKDIKLKETTQSFIKQNPQSHTRIRLNRLLLEETYPTLITKSLGGVYPDREIITPTPDDSQRCFQEYLADAQRRLDHDRNHPNEPRQIKPGEDVRVVDNRVQVSGQVAVMSINALLTKVIFDRNPDHEFYVEESFPLDWMYPHLSPFGIIMKINREPLQELTQEMVDKDHNFWSQFSQRLVGNWITYDTSVSNICDFAEKVYLRRDYKGFKGAPEFIRDNDAQKAFSKLRSSIAGVYSWRVANPKTPVEQQRMLKEAEFSFKQAYAFCPYSPEAVFRYVNLLVSMAGQNPARLDDARRIAETSRKLDPNNGQLENLVQELEKIKASMQRR